MKKLLVVFVLAVAGYLAYHEATMPGPVDAYKKFADAWAWSNNEVALRFAKGDAVERALVNKPLASLVPAGAIGDVSERRRTRFSGPPRPGTARFWFRQTRRSRSIRRVKPRQPQPR